MTLANQTLAALSRADLFACLGTTQLERVAAKSQWRSVPARSPVYLAAPDRLVCLVASGRVKACAETPDDKQQLLYLIGPSELFGEQVLFGRVDPETYYETLEDSSIVFLGAERILAVASVEIRFLLMLTAMISQRRDLAESRLHQVLGTGGEDRLVHFLLELARRYGEPTAAGIRVALRLSHQDLASAIGTTRETVTVILGRLQRDRLVRNQRQQITILDPQKLARRLTKHQADPLVA